ncbi:hypothetical protein [Methylobacterium sp. 17Sr1-1]|uniref:hypothetical protein n=1 Tax=Methylobacterium sp. 17Sr1-1 TaxID=2202826 RepID=UPI000D6F4B3C|nr:hypothetical protein [Methylobacterium sp. 17Sr1-1]AWN52173.1 hypothetical protein DK412_11235 [Methylobacterium sp. 17Sr1-1]
MNAKTNTAPRWLFAWDPPSMLIRTGKCLVPSDLSWRRADEIVKAGFGTIDPHHPSLGTLTLTTSGRTALSIVEDAP